MHPGADTHTTDEPVREVLLRLRTEIEERRDKARTRALTSTGTISAVIGGKELAYDEAIRLIDGHLIEVDQARLRSL